MQRRDVRSINLKDTEVKDKTFSSSISDSRRLLLKVYTGRCVIRESSIDDNNNDVLIKIGEPSVVRECLKVDFTFSLSFGIMFCIILCRSTIRSLNLQSI